MHTPEATPTAHQMPLQVFFFLGLHLEHKMELDGPELPEVGEVMHRLLLLVCQLDYKFDVFRFHRLRRQHLLRLCCYRGSCFGLLDHPKSRSLRPYHKRSLLKAKCLNWPLAKDGLNRIFSISQLAYFLPLRRGQQWCTVSQEAVTMSLRGCHSCKIRSLAMTPMYGCAVSSGSGAHSDHRYRLPP